MSVKICEDVVLSDGKPHSLAMFETDNGLYVLEVKGRFDMSGNDYTKILQAFYSDKAMEG